MVVGMGSGIMAVLLKFLVHHLQGGLTSLAKVYNWIYFISPAIGILITYLIVKIAFKGTLAKGTSHVLNAIAKKSSHLPAHEMYAHVATSAVSVGLGGSAGLESPIVQTGSAVGSSFASIFPISYRDRTLLLACGAAAGIAAAFNAPIAGVLFALEVLLVDISISAFIPLLIAGALGALSSIIILNEDILLSFRNISQFNYQNIPYYVLLGALCGVVSVFYNFIFLRSESWLKGVNPFLARFALGVFLLGMLIVLFPALFGEGYSSIKSLSLNQPERLFEGSPFFNGVVNPWLIGLIIFCIGLFKSFAVSLTLTAGGNGGNFAPSLLVGACLGFAFAFLVNATDFVSLPVSNFTVVAMAGVLTGIFHAPLTAIFLIAEITGGYDLMIPLMIVSALSTATSRYFNPNSLDERKLKQFSESVRLTKDNHVLSGISIVDLVEHDFAVVSDQATLGELVNAIAHSKRNLFPVVDAEHRLQGIVQLENIREIMFDTSRYGSTLVKQIMQRPLVTVNIHEDMTTVMEQFDKYAVWNIPVVNDSRYIGFISQSRVFASYRKRLKE